MGAIQVDTAYLAPLLAISFTTVIGLIGWIVQTMWRMTTQLGQMEERSEDHERRIRDLELGGK